MMNTATTCRQHGKKDCADCALAYLERIRMCVYCGCRLEVDDANCDVCGRRP